MRATNRFRTAVAGTFAAAFAATMLSSAASPKFFNDDPAWVEKDSQDAAAIKPLEVGLFTDIAANVLRGTDVGTPGPAGNVNTIDEVPDSSWFTNRVGVMPITAKQVAVGPDTGDGPADGTWTVRSSKSDGVTPGFTVIDARGDRWFLKFDPRGYRGMSTGTEVTATKLMWALGYNVPENHIAYVRPEQLKVGAEAKFTPASGKSRAMRIDDIEELLERVDREPDGSYRVVASKALPGKPVGRIRFSGTRSDDPNDIVPHEDRRELRGYGVFAAWLNHVDAKAINSLDTLVTVNGKSVVRHHLIDFGSALGSGGVGPADYWAGEEYLVEPRQVAKKIIGFGFYRAGWQSADFYEARSIGRMRKENGDFNPELWRPRVPNQAFLHARADDKFWAARKLAAMTTDMIRAAVRAGEFRDPAAEDFLVRALAQRRDAIVKAYLPAINPVADPVLDATGTLTFSNVAVDADVAKAPFGYRAIWSRFDNATGTAEAIGETSDRITAVHAPLGLPTTDGAYLKVQLSAMGSPIPTWERPVDAYFRLRNGNWRLIGFERTIH